MINVDIIGMVGRDGLKFKKSQPRLWLTAICASVLFATSAQADELFLAYLDDDNQEQTLTVDANSPTADNALAAELILEGNSMIITLDEKNDLELIAAAVSAQAPDQATAKAISNTILGIDALLGGRSVVRSAIAPEADTPPVDTPPVPVQRVPLPPSPGQPSLPPPSSTVVSPN